MRSFIRLSEQLEGELDEVEAALAQHQTLGPAKLKRKETAPEKTLTATHDLLTYSTHSPTLLQCPNTIVLTSQRDTVPLQIE
jgi:predicted ATPase